MAYAERMELFRLYSHLVQEGQEKLVDWFGREMFVDLHAEGALPTTTAPREMLDHLADTYAQASDCRRYLEAVEVAFNAKFAKSQTVEQYFAALQEARDDAKLLGQPFSQTQVENKAIKQFVARFGKDAIKAEAKWHKLDSAERNTWAKFKVYWKNEIKQWTVMRDADKQAHQVFVAPQVDALAVQLRSLQDDMTALQADNRSYHEENSALMAREVEFRQALQAEHAYRQHTGHMNGNTGQQQQRFTGFEQRTMYDGSHGGGAASSNQSLGGTSATSEITAGSYRDHNDGKGLQFKKYCWKCGLNTRHWTRQCPHLSKAERTTYRNATMENMMGGSTKFTERRGKWQRDFNFDSL
jgi:hypothetical protein